MRGLSVRVGSGWYRRRWPSFASDHLTVLATPCRRVADQFCGAVVLGGPGLYSFEMRYSSPARGREDGLVYKSNLRSIRYLTSRCRNRGLGRKGPTGPRQPALGVSDFCARGRQSKEFLRHKATPSKGLELRPPFRQRHLGVDLAPFEKIESQKQCRRFSRQFFHPAFRWMNSLEKVVKRESPSDRHHKFTIEDEVLLRKVCRCGCHFGEVTRQILARLREHHYQTIIAA